MSIKSLIGDRSKLYTAVLMASMLGLAACGNDSSESGTNPGDTGAVDPGDSTGAAGVTVSIVESSITVTYPSVCDASGNADNDPLTNNPCTEIPQGESATLSFTITDNSATEDEAVAIAFASGRTSCSPLFSNGSQTTVSSAGVISTDYDPNGCVGSDSITATVAVAGATDSITINGSVQIATDIPSSISFVGANPTQLDIAGTGGTSESTISFQLVGEQGGPVQGESVSFTLSQSALNNGVTFATGQSTGVTDSSGVVTTKIIAGSQTTPIVVTATLDSNTTINATSNNLSVAGGPPVDGKFTLVLDKYNPAAWRRDNISVNVTATMSDRNGQKVPNGTTVIFTTESGTMVPASCATQDGRCSVSWTSNPADHTTSGTNTSLTTIMAEVQGSEAYNDIGAFSNEYDDGDTYTDVGDFYRNDYARANSVVDTYANGHVDGLSPVVLTTFPVAVGSIVIGATEAPIAAYDGFEGFVKPGNLLNPNPNDLNADGIRDGANADGFIDQDEYEAYVRFESDVQKLVSGNTPDVDLDSDGTISRVERMSPDGDGLFNGPNCNSQATTCATNTSLLTDDPGTPWDETTQNTADVVTLTDSVVIAVSDTNGFPQFLYVDTCSDLDSDGILDPLPAGTLNIDSGACVGVTVGDINGNSLTGGSPVSAAAVDQGKMVGITSHTIPDTAIRPARYSFTIAPAGDLGSGTLEFRATAGANTTLFSINTVQTVAIP